MEIPKCARVTEKLLYHGRMISITPETDVYEIRKILEWFCNNLILSTSKSIYDNVVLALKRHGVKDKNALERSC